GTGLAACGDDASSTGGRPTILVTHAVLGSVVKDLAGDRADVTVLMPAGVDPHEWRPSAKDVEEVRDADLVVANGLHLEEGLEDALEQAEDDGVPVVEAAAAVEERRLGADDPAADEHGAGATDPHFWTDPVQMSRVVDTLATEIRGRLGLDLTDRAAALRTRLTALDRDAARILAAVPEERRILVTGHESLGYFARRYGFRVVGTVIPGLSSQAQVSASALAELKRDIAAQHATVIFTEIGTPTPVVEAIADETGARVVELPSHTLPADGTYDGYIRELARRIADAEG
ncbi:MAG: metal ABC transporter substrate-binding protein, partial [Actinomycetota bacterium]